MVKHALLSAFKGSSLFSAEGTHEIHDAKSVDPSCLLACLSFDITTRQDKTRQDKARQDKVKVRYSSTVQYKMLYLGPQSSSSRTSSTA